jgi:hypothetical protein
VPTILIISRRVSARWPGDAHAFAKRFAAMLEPNP